MGYNVYNRGEQCSRKYVPADDADCTQKTQKRTLTHDAYKKPLLVLKKRVGQKPDNCFSSV